MSHAPNMLSLSRAARLAGVDRIDLQRKIRQGALQAFDGMVNIADLVQAYPDVQLEDNTEYNRLLQIKEKAFGKRVLERVMPSAEMLAARVAELGKELAQNQAQATQFRRILEQLSDRLNAVRREAEGGMQAALGDLQSWLETEVTTAMASEPINPLTVRDHLLRVMAAHVTVMPSRHDFFVDGADTLLESALRAGVPLDYGCSGGNCGLCKAKVISGQVKKTRHHDYVLTETEKSQGYVLMCSNTAVTDLEIAAHVAGGVQDIPFQQIAAKVKSIVSISADMALLHLQTPRTSRLRFLAGQYVTLQLGQSLTAQLPIASCPCDERNILFHVRRMHGNLFSDYVFDRLGNNETVDIEGPAGEFVLQEQTRRPLYFLAFNHGFAPIKSLIEHAMSLSQPAPIHLFWIGSRDSDIYLPNIPRAWSDALDNFHYAALTAGFDLSHLTALREASLHALLEGILHQHPELTEGDVYIAGPESAGSLAEQFFLDAGLPRTRVFMTHRNL